LFQGNGYKVPHILQIPNANDIMTMFVWKTVICAKTLLFI